MMNTLPRILWIGVLFALIAGLSLSLPLTSRLFASNAAEIVPQPPARFVAYDMFIETAAAPLAAWQVEIADRADAATIVGLEGGAAGAFSEPPTYDPNALMTGRIIVANFSTNTAEALPTGRTRVATLHLRIEPNGKPDFTIELTAVATVDGRPLRANVSFEPRPVSSDSVREDHRP